MKTRLLGLGALMVAVGCGSAGTIGTNDDAGLEGPPDADAAAHKLGSSEPDAGDAPLCVATLCGARCGLVADGCGGSFVCDCPSGDSGAPDADAMGVSEASVDAASVDATVDATPDASADVSAEAAPVDAGGTSDGAGDAGPTVSCFTEGGTCCPVQTIACCCIQIQQSQNAQLCVPAPSGACSSAVVDPTYYGPCWAPTHASPGNPGGECIWGDGGSSAP